MQVDLFETLMTDRCAEDPASIDDIQKVQLGSTEMCAIEKSTTTDDTAAFSSPDQSTTSPTAASGSSMQYAWMIVGIAFGALIVIIVVMLIAIVYLNHKRNKIRGKAM